MNGSVSPIKLLWTAITTTSSRRSWIASNSATPLGQYVQFVEVNCSTRFIWRPTLVVYTFRVVETSSSSTFSVGVLPLIDATAKERVWLPAARSEGSCTEACAVCRLPVKATGVVRVLSTLPSTDTFKVYEEGVLLPLFFIT